MSDDEPEPFGVLSYELSQELREVIQSCKVFTIRYDLAWPELITVPGGSWSPGIKRGISSVKEPFDADDPVPSHIVVTASDEHE